MTTEGLKRPGETATAVVTIRNNVGVPTRSAVAVFPGTLHPLGGGLQRRCFHSSGLYRHSADGGCRHVARPVDPAAKYLRGERKALRVRIDQVGPTGQLVNALDEQFVSGCLRVERPQIEMIPLPEEPEIPTPEIPTVAMRPNRIPIGSRVNTNLPEGVFPAAVTRHEGPSATGEPRHGLRLDPLSEAGFPGANATGIPESFLISGGPSMFLLLEPLETLPETPSPERVPLILVQ